MKKNILISTIFLLFSSFSFSNENTSATVIEHYASKTVIVKDKVKENNEISETKEYYSNGKIKKETIIINGEGSTKTYYENGKLEMLIPYKENKINGSVKRYDKEGKLLSETIYKDGVEIKKNSSKI